MPSHLALFPSLSPASVFPTAHPQTVDWFNIKVEEMLVTGEDAVAIRAPCTRAMQRNITLTNRLDQLLAEYAHGWA